jgi:DNA-binding XRE family transcriptional regulator
MAQRNFNTNLTGEERGRIGELVKALRGASGISQKDLAFKVGVLRHGSPRSRREH